MNAIFDIPSAPDVPVANSAEHFTVRRIFCVGRNYAAHAREMGKDPDRDPPFFFTKFAETIMPNGAELPYPPGTSNYHFEGELVVAIGQSGFKVDVDDASPLIFGYAVGLDMTRRDLQLDAREKGRPWDTGKNFAYSAPISTIHPAAEVGHLVAGAIELKVNGETKQRADLADLIWDCSEIVSYLSHLERLYPGDLIFTGTPAGIGAVLVGDRIDVAIEGLTPLSVTIVQAEAA